MGNCCSTIINKRKKRQRRTRRGREEEGYNINNNSNSDEDLYFEPADEENNKETTKIISKKNNNNKNKKKEMASFNTDTVKAALDDIDKNNKNGEDKTMKGSSIRTSTSNLTNKNPTKTLERQSSSSSIKFPKFKKPLSAIPQHLLKEGFQRTKHNSTSSLYITSTMAQPDNDELLKCLASAILYHIEKGFQSPQKIFYDIFSEEKYPITKTKIDTKKMPDVDVIYKLLAMIFKAERLDAECGIMCLAYIERMITLSGLTMDPSNWRRIVLSSLILASKVWEDQSVWNVDFLPVFDNLTAHDLNKLERQFLALLQYNVSLTASLYAKYYFELRTFSQVDSAHFPLEPLDKMNAQRLEDHSQASEFRVRTFKRSASVDQLAPATVHTPAVLS